MREQLQELHKKLFNQDVFIVGGGYSVLDVNTAYLYDKNTIAINDAYKILPNATALFWCDNSWCGREIDKLNAHQTTLRFNTRNHGETHVKQNLLTSGKATVLKRTGDYGFDPDPDSVRGNNGGAQCLNFIINMGAKRIYLIGYDMRDNPLNRGKTHWHDYHSLAIRHDTYSKLFIPSIISMHNEIRRLKINVDIINCSKTSAISCFRKEILAGLIL